jgi:hypothetical protein
MAVRPSVALSAFLLLPLLSVSAGAQGEVLYDFSIRDVPALTEVPWEGMAGRADVNFTFVDASHDSPTGYVPGGPPTQGLLYHKVKVEVQPFPAAKEGWVATADTPDFNSVAGTTTPIGIRVNAYASATDPYFRILVNLTITTQDGSTFHRLADMSFFTKGFPGFVILEQGPYITLGQREIGTQNVVLWNRASLPRAFTFEVGRNDCKLWINPPGTTTLAGYEQRAVPFQVVGPEEHIWYQGSACTYQMVVRAQDNPEAPQSASIPVRVQGLYIDPLYLFWAAAAALLLLLLVAAVRRYKERRDESLLGKPQKPWLIPVEKLYLEALKRKDPRAWYTVRHFLMEDEYRSSLLWYKAYKAATKGDRKKERLILKHERTYERWKAKWARRIAKPLTLADRFESKLQRKLDRRSRKTLRKARRRWRKSNRHLEAAHRKAVERAAERHAKAAAKAAKKGRPEPVALAIDAPAQSPEPVLVPLTLATHRWAKRAARYRRRMEKRQGNLEVRFERQDARYLARLRGKVNRIARKLDDPTFVAEHPLLRDSA